MTHVWKVGGKLGCSLYLDDVIVGRVNSTEIAASIVQAMNRGQLLQSMLSGEWEGPEEPMLRDPPPLTELELIEARQIPVEHGCNTAWCPRCRATRAGQL
jgi:hypothetical protein